MKLIARSEIGDHYWLPDVGAAYTVWYPGSPRAEQAVVAFDHVRRLLVANRSVSYISDNMQLLPASPAAQHVAREWMAKMKALHAFDSWATLSPASATCRLMIRGLGADAARSGTRFAQFDHLDDAVAWTRTQKEGARRSRFPAPLESTQIFADLAGARR